MAKIGVVVVTTLASIGEVFETPKTNVPLIEYDNPTTMQKTAATDRVGARVPS